MCLASCLNHRDINNTVYCQADSEISEFPDSSFFSDITCMYHYKDKVYILDRKRGDVVALSEDFNTMKYVCRHGGTPYETVWPFTFNEKSYLKKLHSKLLYLTKTTFFTIKVEDYLLLHVVILILNSIRRLESTSKLLMSHMFLL